MAECRLGTQYTIDTIYGNMYICQNCADKHPIPLELRRNGVFTAYREHDMGESRKCECEHISHFETIRVGTVLSDGKVHILDIPKGLSQDEEKAIICKEYGINPEDIEWDFPTNKGQ